MNGATVHVCGCNGTTASVILTYEYFCCSPVVTLVLISVRHTLAIPSSRHYLSYDDCLEDKRENYQNCSVLCCVRQLYTMVAYAHACEQFLVF